ncbi:hypothetical protein ACFX13_036316 [Malus domestica]
MNAETNRSRQDHTSIDITKVAIVKATSHDDEPSPPERRSVSVVSKPLVHRLLNDDDPERRRRDLVCDLLKAD